MPFASPYIGETKEIGWELTERDSQDFTLVSCTVTLVDEVTGEKKLDAAAGQVQNAPKKRAYYIEEFAEGTYVEGRRYWGTIRVVVSGTTETPTYEDVLTVKPARDVP